LRLIPTHEIIDTLKSKSLPERVDAAEYVAIHFKLHDNSLAITKAIAVGVAIDYFMAASDRVDINYSDYDSSSKWFELAVRLSYEVVGFDYERLS